jgi:hypothetical protein
MFPHGHLALKNPRGTPMRAKGRPAAKVSHFSAPLKGLSRFAELNEADPLLASILTNWVVEDDRITVRPGYIQIGAIAGDPPPKISTMIPYYGQPSELCVAAGTRFTISPVPKSPGPTAATTGRGLLSPTSPPPTTPSWSTASTA